MREVMVRMGEDLIERADRHAAEMSKRMGLRVTRSDLTRMALLRLLDAEGVEEAPPKAEKRAEKKATKASEALAKAGIDPNADLDAMPNPFA